MVASQQLRIESLAEFDFQYSLCRVVLMVLAASKRVLRGLLFQYSLCRVVLMVENDEQVLRIQMDFQYSLCRVVLMVF